MIQGPPCWRASEPSWTRNKPPATGTWFSPKVLVEHCVEKSLYYHLNAMRYPWFLCVGVNWWNGLVEMIYQNMWSGNREEQMRRNIYKCSQIGPQATPRLSTMLIALLRYPWRSFFSWVGVWLRLYYYGKPYIYLKGMAPAKWPGKWEWNDCEWDLLFDRSQTHQANDVHIAWK